MNKFYTKKDGYSSFAFAILFFLLTQIVLSLMLTPEDQQNGTFTFWLCHALLSLSIGLIAFGYAKLQKKQFVSATTANKKPRIIHALWGCLAVAGLIHFMTPINNWLCDFIESIGLSRPSVDLPMQIAPLIIVACIIPAVTEEFLFRGTVGMGFVNGATKKWKGIVASGALFALFHLNPAQTVHQFVLGCFLMVLTYRSGSVWTACIVHFFNNFVVVLLSIFVPDSFYLNNDIVICIVGGIVFGLALFGYLSTTKCHGTLSVESQKCLDYLNEADEYNKQNKGQGNGAVSAFVAAVAICVLFWTMMLFIK